MNAGILNRRVWIDKRTTVQDSSGDPVVTWEPTAEVWAKVMPLTGREDDVDNNIMADVDTRIRLRYLPVTAALSPVDRIRYTDRFSERIYNIVSTVDVDMAHVEILVNARGQESTMASFEVKGLRELGESLKKLDRDMALKLSWQATGAAARVVKKRAQRNIQSSPSVRTGVLLKSVIIKRMPKRERAQLTAAHLVTVRGRGKRSRKGVFTAGAPYAHLVEFGTVHMPAEPFLRPALEGGQQEAVAAMKKSLERGIARSGK